MAGRHLPQDDAGLNRIPPGVLVFHFSRDESPVVAQGEEPSVAAEDNRLGAAFLHGEGEFGLAGGDVPYPYLVVIVPADCKRSSAGVGDSDEIPSVW